MALYLKFGQLLTYNVYTLEKQLTIKEAICPFHVSNKGKPHKYGIRMFIL
jgi:hypothetical protein